MILVQQSIARRLDALQPVVISFGKVEGGRAFNVIADRVRLLGTVRCMDIDLHERLPDWIEEMVEHLPAVVGTRPSLPLHCTAGAHDPALTD